MYLKLTTMFFKSTILMVTLQIRFITTYIR
jgi:hypothetical protein